jgi:hypothetical protein
MRFAPFKIDCAILEKKDTIVFPTLHGSRVVQPYSRITHEDTIAQTAISPLLVLKFGKRRYFWKALALGFPKMVLLGTGCFYFACYFIICHIGSAGLRRGYLEN